jgi:hypothetical protein
LPWQQIAGGPLARLFPQPKCTAWRAARQPRQRSFIDGLGVNFVNDADEEYVTESLDRAQVPHSIRKLVGRLLLDALRFGRRKTERQAKYLHETLKDKSEIPRRLDAWCSKQNR